jgi:hypothetical protein
MYATDGLAIDAAQRGEMGRLSEYAGRGGRCEDGRTAPISLAAELSRGSGYYFSQAGVAVEVIRLLDATWRTAIACVRQPGISFPTHCFRQFMSPTVC